MQKLREREMEKAIEEFQQQQEKPSATLKCPRCDSLDTKFRYFNNSSFAQPRHYCKTCKRQWTVGGNIRDIPVGGRARNGNPTKASSSRGGNPRSQPPQPLLPFAAEHRQNPHSPTLMTAVVSQSFDTTIFQPVPNLASSESPLESSYNFNDEISCLDAIQSLIQPEIDKQHVNAGSHFNGGGTNMTIPPEWNFHTMESQQAIPQHIARGIESDQTYNEAINAPPSHLYSNSVRPAWPMNSLPQDITNDFSFTTPNSCLWNNFSGDADSTEDTISVNVDEWLNFPDDD